MDICSDKTCHCRERLQYRYSKRIENRAICLGINLATIYTLVISTPSVSIDLLDDSYPKKLRADFAKCRDLAVWKRVSGGAYGIETAFDKTNWTANLHLHTIYETPIPIDCEAIRELTGYLTGVPCQKPERLYQPRRQNLIGAINYMLKQKGGEIAAIDEDKALLKTMDLAKRPANHPERLMVAERMQALCDAYHRAFPKHSHQHNLFGRWYGERYRESIVALPIQKPPPCRNCGSDDLRIMAD